MRLAPVPIWGLDAGEAAMRDVARRQSATTHAAEACLDVCEAFSVILRAAMQGESLQSAVQQGAEAVPVLAALLEKAMDTKRPSADVASSGYVLHSLDAAIWSVAQTDSFRDAVLETANLGDDADTTAAVAGQLAGALYGKKGIPEGWLEN